MAAGQSHGRFMVALLKPTVDPVVCRSCQNTISRRGYATAAAAPAATSTDSPVVPEAGVPVAPAGPIYDIKAGVVLSRTPRITRDLTPFEKAFFFYQRRLNERLAQPFTRYFYFKRGTPADLDWKRKYRERLTPARDIGRYNAYGPDAWNDELLVGATESDPENQVEALVKDAQRGVAENNDPTAQIEEEEVPRPLGRITEADIKKDYRSLDRLQQRTLYLLVQVQEGDKTFWQFPAVSVREKENLRISAERALFESAGPNMNTWMVGYHPIGHHIYTLRNPKKRSQAIEAQQMVGDKTFFLKGRILAGQADLKENLRDVQDFKWLSKEEVREHVQPKYWGSVKNMLADR